MATNPVRYRQEYVGEWGERVAAPDGARGDETLALRDGTRLYFRYWRAADPQAPTLAILHGLGAHSGWFLDMGNELHARGLNVYVNDHRGFGRSDGPRGHVRNGRIYLSDLDAYLDAVRDRQPGSPLFILGHSMGGIFATYLAAADATSGRNRLAGLLLLNPWIQDTTKVTPRMLLSGVIGGLLGSTRVLEREDRGSGGMTLNPEAARLLEADTYWVRNQSQSFLYQISLLRLAVLRRAREIRAPALVLQSEKDLAVSLAATRQCFEALGSADKTYREYPGYAHDAEFEPDRSALDDDIADWILRRAGPQVR